MFFPPATIKSQLSIINYHAGYIGLIEAAKRYDLGTGIKFDSYASWWVRKYMREWMLNHSQIAQQLGITPMTVWRIQDAALKKMKNMLV